MAAAACLRPVQALGGAWSTLACICVQVFKLPTGCMQPNHVSPLLLLLHTRLDTIKPCRVWTPHSCMVRTIRAQAMSCSGWFAPPRRTCCGALPCQSLTWCRKGQAARLQTRLSREVGLVWKPGASSCKHVYLVFVQVPYVLNSLTSACRLQGGRFDAPDRLFCSMREAWESATTGSADVNELIPEFFLFNSRWGRDI